MVNVFMVDSDESTIKEVKQYFSNQSSICIKKTCSDGKEALDELLKNSNDYDVLLLNPILPKVDGLGILKKLDDNNIKCKVIIYSEYNNPNMIKLLHQYNISFYLLKSIDNSLLAERIIDASNINYLEYEFVDNFVIDKISKLLHDLGMPSHIKGYQYVRDAIMMMYDNPIYIGGITKKLYPAIADKYNTTSSRVERAIRHAIEVSWNRGDYDLMDEIFGHSVDFDRAKPTNSEFLATLADRINLNENKYKLNNYN
ncbi:MAG: sporulation transcription factor Spo0A [Bacilli bacterium]|nr:sporulation transcription factor Spo0A [Bacilli bacterium]